MEISPPTLIIKKKILWLLNISLNKVISRNLILNKIILILNTSSRAIKLMPSLYYFVLLFIFYVCVESEGQRSCFISLLCVQCQVDQRTLGLQNHLEITRALEVIYPNPLPSYFINSQPLQKHFWGKECLDARINNFINHDKANWYIIISFKKYVFIYLAVLGFSFSTEDLWPSLQHSGSSSLAKNWTQAPCTESSNS